MYKAIIYLEGVIVTSATGEDREYLERWADEVCAYDEKATYTITEVIK